MVATGDQSSPAPAATPASKQLRRPMAFIRLTEDLVHYVVVAALLVLAGMALYKTGIDLLGRHRDPDYVIVLAGALIGAGVGGDPNDDAGNFRCGPLIEG